MALAQKQQQRRRRHRRVRAKIAGTAARPRLSIHKSNTRIVAQLVNDEKHVTLAAVSSSAEKGKTSRERAQKAAATLAGKAASMKIKKVVFDRGGFQYAGTVKAFAEASRAAGLEF